jgi:CNT family concentrative nucleoside transporter
MHLGSTLPERAQSLFGLFVFIFLAFLIGRARGAKVVPWRVIIWGVILQFVFGAVALFTPELLVKVQFAIQKLLDFTLAGVRMIFGDLSEMRLSVVDSSNRPLGFAVLGVVFAIRILPTIIFVSTLTAILYHLGVMTAVVKALAWVMQKTMGTSGAETLSTAANIFVGQTEAPLLVKPFLLLATRSELMAIMVGGFANIASGVIVAYTEFLKDHVPEVGGHLAAACFISAPATLVVAKLILPETEQPQTAGTVDFNVEKLDTNLIDAATRGTSEGLVLAMNVAAMLIAFTALIAMCNALFSGVTGWFGLGPETIVDGKPFHAGVTIEQVLGYVLAPLAWLSGVSWGDSTKVGALLGVKTVLNEFVAYLQMGQAFSRDPNYLSPRSALIATYALCGFANFASVGIQIGGISTMAPTRRHDLSKIGLLAMVGGAIASFMGACVVGVLV